MKFPFFSFSCLVSLLVVHHMHAMDPNDMGIKVNVSGGLHVMPVEVSVADDVAQKVIGLGTGLACSVTGIQLAAKGLAMEISESTHRHKARAASDLEQGLPQVASASPRESTPLRIKNSKNKPRCSRGCRLFWVGVGFTVGGIAIPTLQLMHLFSS